MPTLTDEQRSLIEGNRKLVTFVLSRWFRRYSREPVLFDRIRGAAEDGLIAAARGYKPDHMRGSRRKGYRKLAKPVKFSTYATHTIWSHAQKRLTYFLKQPIPFRSPRRESALQTKTGTPVLLSNLIPDHHHLSPESSASLAEVQAAIRDKLRFFNPVDRLILSCGLGLDGFPKMLHSDIGAVLGITRVRVRQRFVNALRKFRQLCEHLRENPE
jgi:hypothetical protein